MNKLKENRNKSKAKLVDSKNYLKIIEAIEELLNDCRELGTLYFSMMARLAFISTIILNGLVKNKILGSKLLEDFMSILQTPLTEIQNDLNSYVDGTISKKHFLLKYGHLRPGTYDLIAFRYDKDENFLNHVKSLKIKSHRVSFDEKKFKTILQKNLLYNSDKFFFFVKESITQRERLKFEFTKNLSDALELIAQLGDLFGFSRKEISNLTIDFIFRHKNKTKTEIINLWKKQILLEKTSKFFNDHLLFPPLLINENDFEIQNHYISEPNFITLKKTSNEICIIKNLTRKIDLENKIVLIENADPGYDWIFTKNISGLITKYGGVASHMAIRCSELGLPAAIGCGDILFEQLLNAQKIMLDCNYHHIIILQKKKNNMFLEEKNLLKSLGYIK